MVWRAGWEHITPTRASLGSFWKSFWALSLAASKNCSLHTAKGTGAAGRHTATTRSCKHKEIRCLVHLSASSANMVGLIEAEVANLTQRKPCDRGSSLITLRMETSIYLLPMELNEYFLGSTHNCSLRTTSLPCFGSLLAGYDCMWCLAASVESKTFIQHDHATCHHAPRASILYVLILRGIARKQSGWMAFACLLRQSDDVGDQ